MQTKIKTITIVRRTSSGDYKITRPRNANAWLKTNQAKLEQASVVTDGHSVTYGLGNYAMAIIPKTITTTTAGLDSVCWGD